MGEINRIEGVQRNAARFVCSEYRRGPEISVTALLQQLQWPSLADRRLIARLTLFYNVHTGKINIPLCTIMDRSDSRTRGAKNNYKYISTKNPTFGQSFFPKTGCITQANLLCVTNLSAMPIPPSRVSKDSLNIFFFVDVAPLSRYQTAPSLPTMFWLLLFRLA